MKLWFKSYSDRQKHNSCMIDNIGRKKARVSRTPAILIFNYSDEPITFSQHCMGESRVKQ